MDYQVNRSSEEEAEFLPSEGLLGAICDFLELPKPAREELTFRLRAIGRRYLDEKFFLDHHRGYGTPKEQRRALSAFIRSENGSLVDYNVSPEWAVTIQTMAVQLRKAYIARDETIEPPSSELILRQAASLFQRRYVPDKGRPVDIPLERAVRALVEFFESLTGGSLEVSMNKNKAANPELRSKEAKAAGMLLQEIDQKLTETAIVNMINKVKTQPWPSESPLYAVWRADPAADVYLMPRLFDKDAIARIYLAAL